MNFNPGLLTSHDWDLGSLTETGPPGKTDVGLKTTGTNTRTDSDK